MVVLQQDQLGPIQDFLDWCRSSDTVRKGYRGSQNSAEAEYIPAGSVHDYFEKDDRLRATLKATHPNDDPPDAELIQNHYIRTFAILLDIGQGHMISQFLEKSTSFKDQRLPFDRHPDGFPQSTGCDLLGLFWRKQWKYCPVDMIRSMSNSMDEHSILPFCIDGDRVDSGGSANVYMINVDPDYNHLSYTNSIHESSSIPNTFILKTYRGKEAKDSYEAERKGFIKLNSHGKPKHIVGYYGSFVQNGSYHIILEYAEHGTLETFIEENDPPVDGEEFIHLWRSLLDLNMGLMKIHHTLGDESNGHTMLGWHQDIKPANILVISRHPELKYECELAIADLGLSHFKKVLPGQQDTTDHDTHGTRAYGAPETFRIGTKMQTIALAVTPAVDVWSLGCIYSECATWIGLGRSRVKEYQRQRRKELKELYKRDLGDLFHDGHKPLEAVKHNHTNVKKNCRREDFVTTKVIDDIIVFMMWEVKEHRSNAQQLCGASERVLNAAQADLKAFRVQETTVTPKGKRKAFDAPDQPEPSDSDSDLDHETPPHPNSEDLDTPHTVTVGRASTVIEQPQLSVTDVVIRRKNSITSKLPHKDLLDDLKDRDHVFIVDNTASMLQHKAEMRKVLEALVYLVKRYDPDGVDLIFTKSDRQAKRADSTKKILRVFDKVNFDGTTNMQMKLGDKLSEYRNMITAAAQSSRVGARSNFLPGQRRRQLKRLSLYILTDGCWQPGTDVETPITSMVTKLKEHELLDKQVGVQFIRFGNDPGAISYLDYLDNNLRPKTGLDIVDTTPSDGNVWKMLLGAVNNWFDDG